MTYQGLNTPWKIWNEIHRWIAYPYMRLVFCLYGIPWGQGWRLHGLPIIQKHLKSMMSFGNGLRLRSSVDSNPLGPNHPVILCTWEAEAVIEVGYDFGMTGGSIVASERITIGDRVTVGANCTIVDTDFHPLDPDQRRLHPQEAKTTPIVIEDDVFIGMNSMILKGVTIGRGSVIGAGSVVTSDIRAGVIAAGNPAKAIGKVAS